MLVQVKLNTESEIIWSLPGTNIVMTGETPEYNVNLDLLNEQQKRILAQAIHLRKVISSTPPGDIFRPGATADDQEKNKDLLENAVGFVDQDVPQTSEQLASIAKDILNGKVASVRREVAVCKNIRLLKILLAVESGKKNRKTIIALLNEKIKDVESSVARYAADESQAISEAFVRPREHRIMGQTPVFDVVESEPEEIIIELPDEESDQE